MNYGDWLDTFQQPLLSFYLKQLREQCEDEDGFKLRLREICRTDEVKSARNFEAQERAMLLAVAGVLGIDLRLAWKAGWVPTSSPAPASPESAQKPSPARTVATGRLEPSLASVPLAPPVPPPGAVAPGAAKTPDEWAGDMARIAFLPPVVTPPKPPAEKGVRMASKGSWWSWPAIPVVWPQDGKARSEDRQRFKRAMRATLDRVNSVVISRGPGAPPPTLEELRDVHALSAETYEVLRLARAVMDLLEPPTR